jgi:hypothetical protein
MNICWVIDSIAIHLSLVRELAFQSMSKIVSFIPHIGAGHIQENIDVSYFSIRRSLQPYERNRGYLNVGVIQSNDLLV